MNRLPQIPFGFYPFWFWNDRLEEAEIRRQVAEMAGQGIRGFFIHSRQGLKQPYLSEAFFRMVEVAVEAAERHGLLAHLYDEYPYPSGIAGGEVVLGNPQFYATSLTQRTYDVKGGEVTLPLPRGKVLACVVCPLTDGRADWDRQRDVRGHVGMVLAEESYNETGLTRYNQKRYFASEPEPTLAITLPEGEYRVFASVQTVVERHKYWGQFVDVLNPDAVAEFLRLTHERYHRRLGEKFGTTIPSIFVDETAPGWSARLPEAFRNAYGRDLPPLLPALQDSRHPEHLNVSDDLARLRYRLFCESFEEPISRWCADHRIRYTGEKPSLRLAQLRYMDIPGCDAGHTKAGAKPDLLNASIRGNARAAASAAYFYGREGALCEAFHSLGWSATLQDIKLIAEGLLLHGVFYLVPHGFFYSTHALKKHDAPPTFFFQMPYWERFGLLSARMDRIYSHLHSSFIDARILVLEPSSGLPTRPQREAYRDVLDLLMEEHFEFLLVDTDILRSGEVGNGTVSIREVSAGVVILPPMRRVEAPLQEWLDAFEAAGGIVVRCESPLDRAALIAALRAAAPPSLRIRAVSGDAAPVQVAARRRGDRRLWFLLNTGRERVELSLEAAVLREVPLDDSVPPMLSRDGQGYRRALAPYESALLEEAAGENSPNERGESPVQAVQVSLRGPMTVTPSGVNLLRMHEWEMALVGEDGDESERRTVPAVPLANQLEKGGFRFAPVIRQSFGVVPRLELPSMRVRYRFSFVNEYAGPVELVMEPETLMGDWSIRVNGHEAFGPDRFQPTTAHVRGSLGVEIAPWLRRGENTLTIDLATGRMDGGLRNPLYLAGGFGVRFDPLRLLPRPAAGAFEEWDANGLPYYAGQVEYEAAVDLKELPDGEAVHVDLVTEKPFEDALEISFNGGPWRPALWNPRALLLPRSELKEGRNALRLRVSTSLSRAFEGQWFDPVAHRYREVGPKTGEE